MDLKQFSDALAAMGVLRNLIARHGRDAVGVALAKIDQEESGKSKSIQDMMEEYQSRLEKRP